MYVSQPTVHIILKFCTKNGLKSCSKNCPLLGHNWLSPSRPHAQVVMLVVLSNNFFISSQSPIKHSSSSRICLTLNRLFLKFFFNPKIIPHFPEENEHYEFKSLAHIFTEINYFAPFRFILIVNVIRTPTFIHLGYF